MEEARQHSAMTAAVPPEVAIFEALLHRMLEYKADSRPTILLLAEELAAVAPVKVDDAVTLLFKLVEAIEKLVDEPATRSISKRASERLKSRISLIFHPDMLALNYHQFQKDQKHNIEAVADLISILDQLQFDSESLLERRDVLENDLNEISSKVAKSCDLSDAQQRIIIAQIELIYRSLRRFEATGVVAFRDSISLGVGRLTLELKGASAQQAKAVREVIDDLLRVKDVAETAGGALALTGPYIAGLLTGPILG